MPGLSCPLSLDALQPDRRNVRHFLAVHRPLDRLPGEVVVIYFRDDVGRRNLLAVAERRGAGDRPLLAVLAPGPLAEAARGGEGPGQDVLAGRVPADPLDSAAARDVLQRRPERGDEE